MPEVKGQVDAMLPEVAVWVEEQRVEPMRSLLEQMNDVVRLVAIGGPRVATVVAMAEVWDVPHVDDPRQLVVDHPSAFWLTSSMKLLSLDDLVRALEQGTTVLSLEPFVEDMSEPDALARKQTALRKKRKQPTGVAISGSLVMLGSLVESPGFMATSGALEVIGEQRLLRVESIGPAATRSLFARLYDVWRTVLMLMPLPEKIDASLADPNAAAPTPGSLAMFGGRMAAHARIPEGGAAIVTVSDQHPAEHSVVSLSGEGGSMRVMPDQYTLQLFESDEKEAGDELVPPASIIDLAAWQWRRLLDRGTQTTTDARAALNEQVLACCHACLLSARTREPERPQKFLQILGG